jgi:protein-S-isoprenylcysteine O-methyltransferase Ste14
MGTKSINNLYIKAAIRLLLTPVVMAAVGFITAGTLQYWEAWVFISVFSLCVLVTTIYLALKDPNLLARRMKGGPAAEKEQTQKVIMVFAMLGTICLIVFPAVDHRFGWSAVSVLVVALGNILVVIGFWIVYIVFRENTYSASIIEVVTDQKVIATGPYAVVRHPMYSGSLITVLGVPLALGSWWGLLMFFVVIAGIIWRLLDEEKYLVKHLPRYKDYCRKTRYRLIPSVW